jgi:sulfite reductase alpha subunit-like flavoprotein
MAVDVEKVLLQIIQDFGKQSQEEAATYLRGLEKSKRYQRDIWA